MYSSVLIELTLVETRPPTVDHPRAVENSRSSSMPSQNSGIEYRIRETNIEDRSKEPPRRHPDRIPSQMPTTTEMVVEIPTSNKVAGRNRQKTDVTDSPW